MNKITKPTNDTVIILFPWKLMLLTPVVKICDYNKCHLYCCSICLNIYQHQTNKMGFTSIPLLLYLM